MSEVKAFKLTPDRSVANKRGHEFVRSLHDYLFRPWHKRIHLKSIDETLSVWYVIRLTAKEISFHIATQMENETFLKQRINRYWDRAAVTDDELSKMPPLHTSAAELNYTRHNIFALSADWREDTVPIASILNVVRDMREGDEARVMVCISPYSRKAWQDWSEKAHEEFKSGKTPKRRGASKITAQMVGHAVDGFMTELSDVADTVFDGSESKQKDAKRKKSKGDAEKQEIMLDGRLNRETLSKRNEPVFRTHIYVASHSEDINRRAITLRALSNSFSELAGDNELKLYEFGRRSMRVTDMLNRFECPRGFDDNLMSCSEAGKLFQLPTASLQEEYAEYMTAIERRETGIPEKLIGAKIVLGTLTHKGTTYDWGMPISNWDELCLPRVIIGRMGTGKTTGFGGNWGAYALANGFSVFTIDAAKDQLGEEIEIGARKLGVSDNKIIRLHFGERPIRLDWVEGMEGKRAANRLAGEVLNFFNLHGAEAGVETSRLLRLAAKTIGVIGGSLGDIQKLFDDPEYRRKTVEKSIKRQRMDLYQEWQAFERLTDGMKGKVLEPVFNRLDMLLGDDYLRECFACTDGIDFRKYMTGGYLVRMFVPKRELGAETTDILVDFLMSKIELAMFARPEDKQIPAFVIIDEPHKYESASARWERMSVECRQWRLGLVFMFHYWDQISPKLKKALKTGAHLHLYSTSKEILRDFAEEIAPFTVEEALKTPTHYAINVVHAGGNTITPFMSIMSPPPSKW